MRIGPADFVGMIPLIFALGRPPTCLMCGTATDAHQLPEASSLLKVPITFGGMEVALLAHFQMRPSCKKLAKKTCREQQQLLNSESHTQIYTSVLLFSPGTEEMRLEPRARTLFSMVAASALSRQTHLLYFPFRLHQGPGLPPPYRSPALGTISENGCKTKVTTSRDEHPHPS